MRFRSVSSWCFFRSVTAGRALASDSATAHQETGAREMHVNRFGLRREPLQDDALAVGMHEFALDPDLAVIVRGDGHLFARREFLRLVASGRGDEAGRGIL